MKAQDLGRKNSLFNLINHQPDIYKIYLYAKDRYEAKFQFLISKRESTGLKHFNDFKAFIEYSNDIKTCKILIIFDNMIAHMLSVKKLSE